MRFLGTSKSLIISTHLRCIPINKDFFVIYHKLFGNPLIASANEVAILEQFQEAAEVKLGKPEEDRVIDIFERAFHLIPPGLDERIALDTTRQMFERDLVRGAKCSALSLVVSEGCNLNCPHCLPKQVADGLQIKPRSPSNMDFDTAKGAVDDFLELTASNLQQRQMFFGGREPLMNWEVIRQTIEYVQSHPLAQDSPLAFILFTNCTLMTKEIADFIKTYKICIATSLDGVKSANDLHRPMKNGKSSFDATLRGWSLLKEVGCLSQCVNLTINSRSTNALSEEFLDLMSEWGVASISLNVDETTLLDQEIPDLTNAVLNYLTTAEEKEILIHGQWRMVFENLFRNVGNSINTAFCSAYSGYSVTVRPGGYYSLCSPDTAPLGRPQSLRDFLQSDQYVKKLTDHYVGVNPICKGCNVEGFCMGGCGVASDVAIKNGNHGYSRCEFFRATFDFLIERAAHSQLQNIVDSALLPVPLIEPDTNSITQQSSLI